MNKWQVRTRSLSDDGEVSIAVVEAFSVQPLEGGGLAFVDEDTRIICLIQKDSWIDVVFISPS